MTREQRKVGNQFHPIAWLNGMVPGFSDLQQQEKNAVMQFSLLWSLFEAQVLESSASSNLILKKCQKWSQREVLKLDTFQCFLGYFKERYIEQGKPNDRFTHLHLRKNDEPELVKNVLKGIEIDLGNILAVLLIIVYRYRNNFFHGIKWAYNFHDQLGNFTNANQLLAMVIRLNSQVESAI
jgi:hypothetical protein